MKRSRLERRTPLRRTGALARHARLRTDSRGNVVDRGKDDPSRGRTRENASRRKPYVKTCEHCGGKFNPWRSTQRFCSKRCAASAPRPQRRIDPTEPLRDRWGRSCIEAACAVCGATFLAPRNESLRRKTCSPACAATLKQTTCRDRFGEDNPNFRGGRRAGVRDRAGERRWRAALTGRCAMCRAPGGGRFRLVLHHVCYRQHLRAIGGDEYDPRNALTLCSECHSQHHSRVATLPLDVIPRQAIGFLVDLLGQERAELYLNRYYAPAGAGRGAA